MDTLETRAGSARAGVDARAALAAAKRFLGRAARPVLLCLCMTLLSLVRFLDIPSPFAAALLAGVGEGYAPFTLTGLVAGLALRLLWGLEPDAWQYAGCAALWLARLAVRPRESWECAVLAGLAMLPRFVALLAGGGPALPAMLGAAALPVAMLCAVALRGALTAGEREPLTRGRARWGAPLLCLLMIAGLGYFRVSGANLGQAAAVLATVAAAHVGGAAGGAACGLVAGVALALIGHDCAVAFSLALCGLCCGFVPAKKWLQALVAVAVNLLAYLLSARLAPPLSFGAAALGALALPLMPEAALARLRGALWPRADGGAESRFVRQRIRQLQGALQSVAEALPQTGADEPSRGEELGELLCARCENREACWDEGRERTESMLAAAMEATETQPVTADDGLTLMDKHGCLRAGAIEALARDALVTRRKRHAARDRASFERELTLTHLGAMSDTLGELEALSQGDSMSDLQAAHTLTEAMEALKTPARLEYARRVDGHLQASLRWESMLPSPKHLEALLRELERNDGLMLSIARAERGRVDLEEIPLYSASVGMATLCADGQEVCGDRVRAERCDGGRLLLMLSDGMGHGEEARRQSEKTLELLEKLLEAGYSRPQAIRAANGVMLCAQEAEGYATVDLCDVDLWTGDVYSEKLGACASWIVRGNHFRKMEGTSLPLGVMERAAPSAQRHRLHSGDILVMLSDGVADLFPTDEAARALLTGSLHIQPQRMADAILDGALAECDGRPKDDMSVIVTLVMDRKRAMA